MEGELFWISYQKNYSGQNSNMDVLEKNQYNEISISIFVTNAYGLNYVKTHNNVIHDLFLRFMIHSTLPVMIHISKEQKIDGKHIILT